MKRFLLPGGILKMFSAFLIMIISQGIMAQEIDLLIKNGHVIDPKNNIDSPMDIAISGGKILKVDKGIPSANPKRIIDATGMYVTPGFIDLHTHVFVGNNPGFADGFSCVSPDDITLKAGITTVVDAGTSGWRNFPLFKKNIIDRSTTRVLAFLNIAGSGMTGFPSEEDMNDMDARMTSLVIKQYPEIIVGVKLGHFRGKEWMPFDRSIEACEVADVPLFLECHLPEYSLDELLKRMRPGDIFSHTYCTASDRECILDDKGKLKNSVIEAQKKGVLFDVGHGGGMFHFDVAAPALKQGLKPDSFGSDLHRSSMNSGMKNMLETMSKFLNLGMTLQDVINSATWSPASAIKRSDIGHLSEGAVADIAIVSIRKGTFGFIDTKNNKLTGDRRLEAEMTIRAGKVVWDMNGLAARSWTNK
ncbi:MAG: dihydroorotase [Bacteroidetes bacterium GWA2_40_15]|nr:MAG: dihydroorotase [Bacteroidetes bacterium GWA2_40_15]OFX94846.1 MAG: dihydroorotase [Bacteroidetes bacterium GWC2_40_22]HAM10667.1 amidohydrolase/deacetylase family metallohydrolase [Bacteroidales bacterium]HBH85249.1 amidohydrolase/deacetylase family metallohydrolase [Bacteroidales bacterium]HBQ83848.1 amidohydrolase/deacetylase family metallohydrolase [Bacteroidales bacterium]